MYQLVDYVTRASVTAHNFVFTGETTPWEVMMDMAFIKKNINLDYFKTAPPRLAKYLPFMPIKARDTFISLRETATPLLQHKMLGKHLDVDLYFKMEAKNPTGSFKDRGSAVDISVAKELGAKGMVVASTGNMAASCACYAASANMPCFVFVPEDVPVAKLAQVISYGGRIVQIKGTYNDCARLAQSVAEEMDLYLGGDYAFRVEGQKAAAFEVIDQLLFQAPDVVIVPIGCGTNIAAYAKGFNEYYQLGLITKIPRLIGVQSTGAKAVINAYNAKQDIITPLEHINTVASAIAVADPLDGIKALHAMRSTGGQAVAVTDEAMLKAQYQLATTEGLFVESASAATVAAMLQLAEEGRFSGEKVVCVLTGDGLKDATTVLKSAIKPPTIYPELDDFAVLYQEGVFNNKTMVFLNKQDILFDKPPSLQMVKQQLKEIFNAVHEEARINAIAQRINAFLAKGKHVSVADFQDIVQDVRESPHENMEHKHFVIEDFSVTTGKDKVATAQVVVTIEKQQHQASGEGVGPVDALIHALRNACLNRIDFTLTDYKVDIRDKGVDAGVYVEMKLVKDHLNSLGRATSPDILQASIAAFEDAYNGFLN